MAEPDVLLLAPSKKRRAYEVDTGGATYWVVALNLRGAVDAVLRCWDNEGSLEATDGFSIEKVAKERARKIRIKHDGDGGSDCMLDLANEATKDEVVGCSEWP